MHNSVQCTTSYHGEFANLSGIMSYLRFHQDVVYLLSRRKHSIIFPATRRATRRAARLTAKIGAVDGIGATAGDDTVIRCEPGRRRPTAGTSDIGAARRARAPGCSRRSGTTLA